MYCFCGRNDTTVWKGEFLCPDCKKAIRNSTHFGVEDVYRIMLGDYNEDTSDLPKLQPSRLSDDL